ncbi:class I SAM-dependent methyltransferase [Streptomyces californicus]|uniref:class I SAM-dependent methyltransferase n=1 Tax=Streptomyces californicus TaxID=67351 RepID=UPI0004BEA400|nr:class I SAM-dependent methyltransferase [Streptomyces californicus]QRV53006.1 class I SAM-dependent methyltransferase [Streptomyces californicus]
MREQYVEALLYDWHNQHKLRNQRLDLEYWLTLVPPQQNTVVLGAGTGRVASPLATRPGSRVVAVDLSRCRLARIPAAPGLHPVCADMRRLPLSRTADQVVIPYSTFQLLRTAEDRERALAEAVRIMRPGATLHIDVSSNFDLRESSDWQRVLSASCEEVSRQPVEEWERTRSHPDHILIDKTFRTDECVLLRFTEHWTHLRALNLEAALVRAGLTLERVDHGYGGGASPHRRIYHARRTL